MNEYEQQALSELRQWQQKMARRPSLLNRMTKGVQTRMNRIIPEKVHAVITTTIRQITRAVIFGAGFTTGGPKTFNTLQELETKVRERIKFYRYTAAAEGAVTGAGGILLGFVDFPAWLTLKMKMLFEIGSLYGHDLKDYRERIFLLHIFQLTFSSQRHRNKIYATLADWTNEQQRLPGTINELDWRSFQQEYRDYIDLAKMLQLVPWVGAVVGAYVNHRLTDKLGGMAMNAYRLRRMDEVVKGSVVK